MPQTIFQVSAFASRHFEGNPAAVTAMNDYPDGATLRALAALNNLPKTAFLVCEGADDGLRWFTPRVEAPLCGHAMLASAAVVMQRLEPGRKLGVPLRGERAGLESCGVSCFQGEPCSGGL